MKCSLKRRHLRNFNPRTREGCDFHRLKGIIRVKAISIHAPARGATMVAPVAGFFHFHFNPRTREGCDYRCRHLGHSFHRFQSTHPRGVRLAAIDDLKAIVGISIHAPARGATSVLVVCFPYNINFNPRTREGCDKKRRRICERSKNFNPRTREGCDVTTTNYYELLLTFQSTHPRGVRQIGRQGSQGLRDDFNPRTREGCDLRGYAEENRERMNFNPRTREGCD